MALLIFAGASYEAAARMQVARTGDYGVNLNIAIYQHDDARSKQIDALTKLNQTVSSAEEEIELITRTYGIEELKLRHLRSVGLRAAESFTDSQPMNERQLVFTIQPREVTREAVKLDFTVRYVDQVLLEARDVSVGNYETVMLRGARGDFGVREFIGPNGTEQAPEKRALLVTITPTIIATRGLQNRPFDISRPTDQFGAVVRLKEKDLFVMPSILVRVPPKFVIGTLPKGSITLEGIVTPEGRITNVRVLDTPDSAYNARVIEAFRQYHFKPAMLNGQPTYATYRETIIFNKPGPL
jgi:TonB family protein